MTHARMRTATGGCCRQCRRLFDVARCRCSVCVVLRCWQCRQKDQAVCGCAVYAAICTARPCNPHMHKPSCILGCMPSLRHCTCARTARTHACMRACMRGCVTQCGIGRRPPCHNTITMHMSLRAPLSGAAPDAAGGAAGRMSCWTGAAPVAMTHERTSWSLNP